MEIKTRVDLEIFLENLAIANIEIPSNIEVIVKLKGREFENFYSAATMLELKNCILFYHSPLTENKITIKQE